MNKDNLQKAKDLSHSQYLLKLLKDMVKSRYFGVKKRRMFEDYWSKINFYEFDERTLSGLQTIISDYCDKRNEEINKEIENL